MLAQEPTVDSDSSTTAMYALQNSPRGRARNHARWRLIPAALGIVAMAAVGAWTGTATKAMAQGPDPAAPHHAAAVAPNHHPVTTAPAHHPTTAPASQPSPHVEYYCPMHPNIVRDQPGKCPICGMTLRHRAPSPHHPEVAPTTPPNHMH